MNIANSDLNWRYKERDGLLYLPDFVPPRTVTKNHPFVRVDHPLYKRGTLPKLKLKGIKQFFVHSLRTIRCLYRLLYY